LMSPASPPPSPPPPPSTTNDQLVNDESLYLPAFLQTWSV
jgi:hypothetical protein